VIQIPMKQQNQQPAINQDLEVPLEIPQELGNVIPASSDPIIV
jgi:hypothetical protein